MIKVNIANFKCLFKSYKLNNVPKKYKLQLTSRCVTLILVNYASNFTVKDAIKHYKEYV